MPGEAEGIQIHVHLVDGSTTRFVQDKPEVAAKILQSVSPGRIFSQPTLVIGGSYSTSTFPYSAITHLTFITTEPPEWALIHDESSVLTEIPREEFMTRFNAPAEDLKPREQARKVGEPLISYGRLSLVGGGRIYIQIETQVRMKIEQRHVFQRIFAAPSFVVQLAQGRGFMLINTANVMGLGLFPGPPELPATAWPAHHMPDQS